MLIPIGRNVSDLGTGIWPMWGRHLKKRDNWWHYYRAVPNRYRDVDARGLICFALRTADFAQAKLQAAQISYDLDQEWKQAVVRGASLSAQNHTIRFGAALAFQQKSGLKPQCATEFSDEEMLRRLRMLLSAPHSTTDQSAILGLINKPEISMFEAFERFWEHIEDEWSALSHDQKRVKRNAYLKALSNFKAAVGDVSLYDVDRSNALEFRKWWLGRLKNEGLNPHTGNKDINALRRLISTNFDIDSVETSNPFARIRLKDVPQTPREPLSLEQINNLLVPGALGTLHSDFCCLLRMLINTGMRPVEAIGLELDDIILDHEVPHVHVRRNGTRGLKTDHSERLLPLLGVSLQAAEELVAMGGWGKRLGKNMYATTVINKQLRASGIVTDKRQSLYSLRHWFQDQLTKRDVIDRAQAQLMGHKFHRPKYGYGKDLGELRDILKDFAL